ncbi:discoidin domain-containing protein [Eubacteriales bacterium OttesenSCG-928-G02]|nr:discoidin domain-containing protein [Eubacteriales bacterium OttesenSCG-928-G02]
MKKIITSILAISVIFAMVLSMGVSAAPSLKNVEALATYSDPYSSSDAKNSYADDGDEQRLFDGSHPTADELDNFVATTEGATEWYSWNGWIGTPWGALTDAATGRSKAANEVEYVFTFSSAVDFKQMVIYASAGPAGNISLPLTYELYLSDDGETWGEKVADVAGEGDTGAASVNTKLQAKTTVALEKATTTKYVKLRMTSDAGNGWCFLSEVELYAEEEGIVVDPSSTEPTESSTGSSTKTGDSGYVAGAIIALITLAGVYAVKKAR